MHPIIIFIIVTSSIFTLCIIVTLCSIRIEKIVETKRINYFKNLTEDHISKLDFQCVFDAQNLSQKQLEAHYLSEADLKKENHNIIGIILSHGHNQHLGPQVEIAYYQKGKINTKSFDAYGEHKKITNGKLAKITLLNDTPIKIELENV